MSYASVKKVAGEKYARALRDAEGGIMTIPELGEVIRHVANRSPGDVIPYLQAVALENSLEASEEKEEKVIPRHWSEILAEAGYTATVVKNMKDQIPFERYYRENERLCSFSGSAWNWKLIMMIVRHDADTVQPADKPEQTDDYSTSVLRVKVSPGAVSIVSRYNHSVNNGDYVYRGNLDAIAKGLTESICHHEDIQLDVGGSRSLLPTGYFVSVDGRLIYAPVEQGGVQLGDSAWLDAGVIHTPEKHEVLIEGCILGTDFMMRPVAEGSDMQGIMVPWNDNLRLMKEAGYTINRQGESVVAKKDDEVITLMTWEPAD